MCGWLAGIWLCSWQAAAFSPNQFTLSSMLSVRNSVVSILCRIQRDVADRGRDVGGVIEQYTKFVKPMFDQYVAPSRKHADVIIPWAR